MEEKKGKERFQVLEFVKGIFTCPAKTIKGNLKYFKDPKVALISALVIAGMMMILHFVGTVFGSFFTKECDWLGGSCKTVFTLEGLKHLNYVDLIFKTLMLNVIYVFAFAGVFYLGSLIAKKDLKFMEVLSLIAIAMVPTVIATYILGPIVGMIYAPLGGVIKLAGTIWTTFIAVFSINDMIVFKDTDQYVFYHFGCLSTLSFILMLISLI